MGRDYAWNPVVYSLGGVPFWEPVARKNRKRQHFLPLHALFSSPLLLIPSY